MDPKIVATEMARRLGTIDGLRPFAYPPDSVTAPAGIVSYPKEIEFDQTYGRGLDRIEAWPVVVVVGKVTDRTAADRIYAYAAATGPASVKRALEARDPAPWDDLQVRSCEFEVVEIAGVDHIAALFTCSIYGQGAR